MSQLTGAAPAAADHCAYPGGRRLFLMPLDRTPWTDETVLPWGDHKGTKLGDVDARYLLWLYEQKWISGWPGMFAYLEANKERILAAREKEASDPLRIDTYTTFEDYLRDTRGY